MHTAAQAHNESISTFLERYCNQKAAPGYAVLLRGPWGSGKTWFIENYRKRLLKQDKRALYVSLFGVTKPSDITEQLFAQIHPKLGSPSTKIAWGIAKSFIKGTIKLDLDGDGKDEGSLQISLPEIEKWASQSGAVLIFDDLERSGMRIEDSLGIMNQFIEHDGYRVIVIANDSFLVSKSGEEFDKLKEKIIGRSFQIHPDADRAINHFIGECKDRVAHSIILENKPEALEVFNLAPYQNLRLLRQAIFDFCDLWDGLSSTTTNKNRDFQRQLIKDSLIISIEFRSGAFSTSDIAKLGETDWSTYFDQGTEGKRELPPSRRETAMRRYGLDSGRPLALPSAAFFEFFETGNLSAVAAERALNNSHFLASETTAPWRRLWYLRSIGDDDFDRLSTSTLERLTTFNYSDLYELIHTTAIFLHLAKRRLIRSSPRRIEQLSLRTVKRSILTKSLQPPSQYELTHDLRDGSAYGLGFTDRSSDEFRSFTEKLKTELSTARTKWIKNQVAPWMKLFPSDVESWSNHLAKNIEGTGWFNSDAVLHHLSAASFCQKLMSLSTSQQNIVQTVFAERFQQPNLYADWLLLERPFLEKLRGELTNNPLLKRGVPKKLSHFAAKTWFLPALEESIAALDAFKIEISARRKKQS